VTDIVYPVGIGSVWNNREIKYSLRSIERHLSGLGKVFLVGECPSFLTNVIHIPHKDSKNQVGDINILHKLKRACEHPDISDQFLCVHDDHYMLQDFEAENFPYFYSGTLEQYAQKRASDRHGKAANNTIKHLASQSKPTKMFDIHHPFLYDKKEFLNLVSGIDLAKQFGYMVKSLYANSLRIEGVESSDSKSIYPPKDNRAVFSSHPRVTAPVAKFLLDMFPQPSNFELK
jgi:hypothetical protein